MNATPSAASFPMRSSLSAFLIAITCLAPTVALSAAEPFEISEHAVRISAEGFERVLALTNGNASTIRLRVNGQALLAGPAPELSLIATRAEPNRAPKGLKPGEGG